MAIARKSFSRLIAHSTTCRPLYASLSKLGGRPPSLPLCSRVRRASARNGQTQRIPLRRNKLRYFPAPLGPFAESLDVYEAVHGLDVGLAQRPEVELENYHRMLVQLRAAHSRDDGDHRSRDGVWWFIPLDCTQAIRMSSAPFFPLSRLLTGTHRAAVGFDVGAIQCCSIPVNFATFICLHL